MTTLFQTIFSNSNITNIAYNPDWENGTGYFNGAASGTRAPKLEKDQAVKTTDNTGRKIIILGYDGIDNIVLFERYSDNKHIVVNNVSSRIAGVIDGERVVSDETLIRLFTEAGFEVSKPKEVNLEMPKVIITKSANKIHKTICLSCVTVVGIAFLSILFSKK